MLFNPRMRAAALACLTTVVLAGAASREPAESIRQVATLLVPRSVHTATTLPSGQVLVVGGMADGGGSLASAEIFDPLHNTVREVAPLAQARASHTATLLRDGRVLVAGGYNGEYLVSVELFDPSTNRFQPAGALSEGRSGHTATLMADGRILFVGGVGPGWTFLRSAELYDPATGRSQAVGSMSVPRESHTATLLADGRVMVAGGHKGRREAMVVYASTELFSPSSGRFERGPTLATARHKHDAIRLADGRVLVIGGADRSDRVHFATTEMYKAQADSFEPGPTMNDKRYKIAGTSVLLPSGDVLVTSGGPVAEILDHEQLVFREVPGPFPMAYHFAAAAPLSGGEVFIAGGYGSSIANTPGVWRFQPE